ncbi:TPA: hypothetical protein DDW69_03245 [candidate division CPR2 bacterium]|uniref:G5 domain-containing protein n=1 Tax=candidate division CPR2 bacterium GW2011_GWC1_41_48 TaxID=1618344 RepID=A0A0G0W7Z3_UNCC2|nr:MAG: hypothetical protein UT47_C0003G0156 [candidate division CPR2 bacterium GW2011_GWC2_39_35]KKS09095.1 MAG: hypothetical protein UU65_C0003G0150 [candidate division CPR2 bacterium GW2011_GWC1_41_48]HBG81832.1 hypothetical protein [candidate division CPR2 bacterium]HCL99995.1 hypothetical protein [candidate division CPR2 bacterium]
MPKVLVKKLSLSLATFVLIPASVSGNLTSSNEIIASRPLTSVTINSEGNAFTIRSSAKNVREVLDQAKISRNEFDAINPGLDTELNGGTVNIEIVKALPVLILDEMQPIKTFSGLSDPMQILAQHNFNLAPEDRVESSLVTDFAKDGWIGQKIQIRRATKITVTVDGTTVEVRSWANTVREALAEKKIILGDKDKINVGLDSLVMNGLNVEIIRVAESVVKKQASILRTTTYQDDYELLKGQQEVIDEGEDGLKEQAYRVTFENGQVASQDLINEVVTKSSKPRVIKRGRKPGNPNAYWNTIVDAGKKYGVDPADLYCVMLRESGGNPYSVDSTGHVGLFQWDDSFYKYAALAGFAGATKYDTAAQIHATAYRVVYGGAGWKPWPNTSRVCGCK